MRPARGTRPGGGGVIFELQPPEGAGPLFIGATGNHIVEVLKQFGVPQLFCRTQGAGLRGPSSGHQAFSSAPTSMLTTAWRPSSSDDRTARTTPSPTTDITYSPRPWPTLSRTCAAALRFTRRRTDTPSPHPACSWLSGGRPCRTRQTTRRAASPKASSLRGLATTRSQLGRRGRATDDQSTGLDNCSFKGGRPRAATTSVRARLVVSFLVSYMFVYLGPSPATAGLRAGRETSMSSPVL